MINLALALACTDVVTPLDSGEQVQEVDKNAPFIEFVRPLDGGVFSAGVIPIEAEITDDGEIVEAVLYIDGVLVQDFDPAGPYAHDAILDVAGDYRIRVSATDDQDNTTTETIEVEITESEITECEITRPADGSTISAATEIQVDASEGTTSVDFYANDILLGQDGEAPWAWAWTPPSFEDGVQVELRVVAFGEGSECEATSTVTLQGAETLEMTVIITKPGDGDTITGAEVPVWAVVETEAVVDEVRLYAAGDLVDTQSESPWRFSLDSRGLSNGEAAITVEATQSSGAVERDTVTVTVSN